MTVSPTWTSAVMRWLLLVCAAVPASAVERASDEALCGPELAANALQFSRPVVVGYILRVPCYGTDQTPLIQLPALEQVHQDTGTFRLAQTEAPGGDFHYTIRTVAGDGLAYCRPQTVDLLMEEAFVEGGLGHVPNPQKEGPFVSCPGLVGEQVKNVPVVGDTLSASDVVLPQAATCWAVSNGGKCLPE
jgi:hypothetical protein